MIYHLTIIIALFCTQCGFAQNIETAKLDPIIIWLENHVKIFEDSTFLGENSREAIQLSEKIENQRALAKSYYFHVVYREYSQLDSTLFQRYL